MEILLNLEFREWQKEDWKREDRIALILHGVALGVQELNEDDIEIGRETLTKIMRRYQLEGILQPFLESRRVGPVKYYKQNDFF